MAKGKEFENKFEKSFDPDGDEIYGFNTHHGRGKGGMHLN